MILENFELRADEKRDLQVICTLIDFIASAETVALLADDAL